MKDREAIVPAGMEPVYEQIHYAPAVRVGRTIYVSGQIGRDEATGTLFIALELMAISVYIRDEGTSTRRWPAWMAFRMQVSMSAMGSVTDM